MSNKMGKIFPRKIKQIMNGETPEISLSMFDPNNISTKHNVGDIWDDVHGNKWEQKEGYISKVRKIQVENGDLRCKVCNKLISHKIDKKTYKKRDMCLTCLVKEDTDRKIKGTYLEYEDEVIKKNELAFLVDSSAQIGEYLKNFTGKSEFVTEDGKIEKWNIDDANKIRTFFEDELVSITQRILELQTELK